MTATTIERTSQTSGSAAATSLLTDQYELTMLATAIADGTAGRAAVFELFARKLPTGRRYGVFAGLGRALEAIENFTFDNAQLDFLRDRGVIDAATTEYLRDFRFQGTIRAYREGEIYFGHSPVLAVETTFGHGLLLETLLLSILNHDSAIASAAARMVTAAAGRPLLEMGSRRTHEQAAVAAARAAYVAGIDATSNLQAGYLYGIPTFGTSAHAGVLARRTELEAFQTQVSHLGAGTTLLVDTYDTPHGIRTAVEAAGTELGGVRIDSGNLRAEAFAAREQLDALGATNAKVVITGDMDEYRIAALADAPVDTFGVGTRLVTGSGAPTAGMVYKLVAIADDNNPASVLRPVAKKAAGKASVGGAKVAHRIVRDGVALAELVRVDGPNILFPEEGRVLQVPVLINGVVVHRPTLDDIRAHHLAAKGELTPEDLDLDAGEPRMAGFPIH
jgi:nicotinate phosphoribosyltransferase